MQLPIARSHAVTNLVHWITRPTKFIERNTAELGQTFLFDVAGWGRVVMSGDPEVMMDAAALGEDDLSAEGGNGLMRSILGDRSLFILEGAAHDAARKLNRASLASIDDDAFRAEFRGRLAQLIQKAQEGKGLRVLNLCRNLALRSTLEITFGDQRLAETSLQSRLNDALGTLATFYAFVEPMRAVGIGPLRLERIAEARIQHIDDIIYGALDDHLRERPERRCFLKAILAEMEFKNTPEQRDFVRDQLVSAMLAGYDTTAASMQWLVELSLGQPEHLASLRQRIAEAGTDAERTRWLDAFIAEVQRLRPTVESFSRLTMRDLVIGEFEVPKDALFTYSIYMVHRNPAIYDDPENFCLNRFMTGKPAYPAFIPFGMGARYCVGAKYAKLQLRELLAYIASPELATFWIRRASLPSRRNVVLAPSRPTRIQVR